jgi:hypothetical protein
MIHNQQSCGRSQYKLDGQHLLGVSAIIYQAFETNKAVTDRPTSAPDLCDPSRCPKRVCD